MRIALASDLHLEFKDIDLKNTENADVLVLSGDILVADDLHTHKNLDIKRAETLDFKLGPRQETALRFRNFLKRCSDEFPHVVYVAGNHEFYHGRWRASLNHLWEECSVFPNVYFLEQEAKVINDVTFLGSTLWTNMNKGDPLTMHAVNDLMSDFKLIRNDERNFAGLRPIDVLARHNKTMQWLDVMLRDMKDRKVVVVGHHAPCQKSTSPKYAHEVLMNGAYSSDLSEFILDRPQIKLWTHGHTHDPFDYVVGDTRIVCNPRGYAGWEPEAEFFQLKFLDV